MCVYVCVCTRYIYVCVCVCVCTRYIYVCVCVCVCAYIEMYKIVYKMYENVELYLCKTGQYTICLLVTWCCF
jgi:hypothetical protein